MHFASPKFITINPDEAKHPLMLGLNGDKKLLWWKLTELEFDVYLQARYKTMAVNPVVQAQFFDIIMKAVLNVLFGF